MKRLIDAIIEKWFCKHKWEAHSRVSNRFTGHTIATVVVCTKCGKFKRIHV